MIIKSNFENLKNRFNVFGAPALFVELYDTGKYCKVSSIDGYVILGEHDRPLACIDDSAFINHRARPTHIIEVNPYFDPDNFDSCADQWFTVPL